MTVTGLNEGDVVYVYDAEPLTREKNTASWTKTSLPVAAGETSAVIHGVRIVRARRETDASDKERRTAYF